MNVLLVASDRRLGGAIADRLEADGHELMWCPGPKPPDMVCGASRGICPLSADATVAVIDGRLASDLKRTGMPSWRLARYYRRQGIPVVALMGEPELIELDADPNASVLPRDVHPDVIAQEVNRLGRLPRRERALTIEIRTA
jgi:hypothetical protein